MCTKIIQKISIRMTELTLRLVFKWNRVIWIWICRHKILLKLTYKSLNLYIALMYKF